MNIPTTNSLSNNAVARDKCCNFLGGGCKMCNSMAVSLDDQLFLCRPQLQIEKIYYEPGEKGVVYASTAREGTRARRWLSDTDV